MRSRNKRLHPQELKRRLKLSYKERLQEWLKTREGVRQAKNK